MAKNQPTKTKILVKGFCVITIITLVVILLFFKITPKNKVETSQEVSDIFFKDYSISHLTISEESNTIKYGHELFINTPKYLGPSNGNPDKAFAGNRLSCKNCHLNSGTKPYSAPLIGVAQRFPQFRGRENKICTIEERINGCMERSMNGHVLPIDSKEMKAFVSYLDWLSRFAPDDENIKGIGFVKINIPNRAVDLKNGKNIFLKNCVVCHTANGNGLMSPDGLTYIYPPLWGNDSYNNGAGMSRVITAAQFIKANMPFGVTYNAPVLTDEEAYDVAGYINQQERPKKSNTEKDFPDLKKKPVSTPYPPYADAFSVKQHQVGPFQPIIKFYKKHYKINKTK